MSRTWSPWLLWVATQPFELQDGRRVSPGVDREFSPTPAPPCAEGAQPSPGADAASLTVEALEWRFVPATLEARPGEKIRVKVANSGSELHTFTIPSLQADSGPIAPGQTATLDFDAPEEPVTAEFICTFAGHAEAGMVGEVTFG
jgi:plastocyanin